MTPVSSNDLTPRSRRRITRRSPVEIVATMGSYLTRTQVAQVSGLRAGPFGRWADGVTAMREDCMAFAAHWRVHNEEVLDTGQALAALRQQTGQPWRVLNLSVSGSLTRDVIGAQLPRLPAEPDLVTCGIGINDILYTAPT